MKDDFYDYRQQKGYSLKTIQSQDSYIGRFKSWLVKEHIPTSQISYHAILSHLSFLRQGNRTPQGMRNHLQAIRVYLDYLVSTGILNYNPAGNIHLRSVSLKPLSQALNEELLLEIYRWFASLEQKHEKRQAQHLRDTVVLGLLLFQGLDSGDIQRLCPKDINPREGTIYIPSSRTAAARKLKLESLQILSIQEYLTLPSRNINELSINDHLFTKSKIQDMVSAIVRKVKQRYPEVMDPRHIRSSVIQNWLRTNHIRQVQYMAGHRSITSTERYQKDNLHDLSIQLQKYHPMK